MFSIVTGYRKVGGGDGGWEGGRQRVIIPPLVVPIEDIHPEVEHAQADTKGWP